MLIGFMLVMTSAMVVSSSMQPPFMDNTPTEKALENVFENITETKHRWWERFGHAYGLNESKMEQKWNEWQHQWHGKFNATSEKFKEKWKNVTMNFQRMRKNHSFFGGFSYEDGYGVGNFVRFLFDDGDIVDYTIIRNENITVFDFVRIENFYSENEPEVHGVVWRVDGENETIEIHDNPTALLKVKVKNAPCTVQLNLADGIHANTYPNNSHIVAIDGEIEGKIILSGEGGFTEVSNDSIVVAVENNGLLLFVASPVSEVCVNLPNHKEYEEKIAEGIANGKVCAELLIQADNKTDKMLYSDVEVNCTTFTGRVRVQITASGEGKTLVLNVHKEVLNATNVTVTLDGDIIPKADDYDDVLNIGVDESAEYLILIGSNGVQILISIPSFSTHTIEVALAEEEETGATTPGFDLLVTITIVSFIVILSYRKKH